MNYADLKDDFLQTARSRGAFYSDMKFDLIAAEVFVEKVAIIIETEREIAAAIAEEEQILWAYEPKEPGEHFKHIAHLIRHREEVFKK
jgi:hypothetical protein